jgi:phage tail sheath protein FI
MPTYLSPGVYVEEVDAGSRPIEGVGTAVAAFVGLAAQGPFNSPTLITNWAQFTQVFGEFVEGSYLAHAVYGYFANGGGTCYVVRIGENGASDGKGAKELSGSAQATLGGYRVRALEDGPDGNDLSVEVADAGGESPPDGFKLVVKRGGKVEESFDGVTAAKGRQNVATVVNAKSKLIRIEEVAAGGAIARPARGTVALAGGAAAVPSHLGADDYVGDSAERTGFGGLEAVDEVTMVCVPDLLA